MSKRFPFLSPASVAPNTYRGQGGALKSVAAWNFVMAHKDPPRPTPTGSRTDVRRRPKTIRQRGADPVRPMRPTTPWCRFIRGAEVLPRARDHWGESELFQQLAAPPSPWRPVTADAGLMLFGLFHQRPGRGVCRQPWRTSVRRWSLGQACSTTSPGCAHALPALVTVGCLLSTSCASWLTVSGSPSCRVASTRRSMLVSLAARARASKSLATARGWLAQQVAQVSRRRSAGLSLAPRAPFREGARWDLPPWNSGEARLRGGRSARLPPTR